MRSEIIRDGYRRKAIHCLIESAERLERAAAFLEKGGWPEQAANARRQAEAQKREAERLTEAAQAVFCRGRHDIDPASKGNRV